MDLVINPYFCNSNFIYVRNKQYSSKQASNN